MIKSNYRWLQLHHSTHITLRVIWKEIHSRGLNLTLIALSAKKTSGTCGTTAGAAFAVSKLDHTPASKVLGSRNQDRSMAIKIMYANRIVYEQGCKCRYPTIFRNCLAPHTVYISMLNWLVNIPYWQGWTSTCAGSRLSACPHCS